MLQKFPHLFVQSRQISMDGLPDNLQVDLEVTVRDSIAHLIGDRQGQFGVPHRERGVVLLNVVAGLADDLEVADHGILRHFTLQEGCFVEFVDVAPHRSPNLTQMCS